MRFFRSASRRPWAILSGILQSTALTAEDGLTSAVFGCYLTMEGTIAVRAFTSPTVDVPQGPVVVVVRVSDVCPVLGEGLGSPTLLFEAEHVVAHSRC